MLYPIFKTENRGEGRTDHVMDVEAESGADALARAEAMEPCPWHSHYWAGDPVEVAAELAEMAGDHESAMSESEGDAAFGRED